MPVTHRAAAPARRASRRAEGADFGAFVISLDFELLWGVRDKYPADGGAYRENLLGARRAVVRMLGLFNEYGVSATWAAVGMLFARSGAELESLRPRVLPEYQDRRLSPFDDSVGGGEADDPLHYAPGLIGAIRDCPGQELATHTYSHYYCLEPGQTRDAFAADLASARVAAAAYGVTLRSIVFPRNQYNPAYDDLLREAGIVCYRSNEPGWLYDYHNPRFGNGRAQRALRKVDAYLNVSGSNLTPWADVATGGGLCRVGSSRFLRPYSRRMRHLEPLRLRRISAGLRAAAERKEIYHLWWHPHNVGKDLEENMAFLRRVLDEFAACRKTLGMRSLTMAGVAEVAIG